MPCKPLVLSFFWVLVAAGGTAFADDPCAAYKWDVAAEHALFAGAGASLTAGKDVASAPTVVAGRLYELKLLPQASVVFAVEPGKRTPDDAQFAGVAALELAGAGDYRVSVDAPAWLDVASNAKLAAVEDFQGLHGCDAPRKIVAFKLEDSRGLVLQVSSSAKATIRLTVTKAPPRT